MSGIYRRISVLTHDGRSVSKLGIEFSVAGCASNVAHFPRIAGIVLIFIHTSPLSCFRKSSLKSCLGVRPFDEWLRIGLNSGEAFIV